MSPNSHTAPADSQIHMHTPPLYYALSLLIALLLTMVSAAGLLLQDVLYPTEILAQSFVTTDLVNLIIGVPILLGSMWYARRSKLIGLLFWPGALLFVVYHTIVYVYAMPLTWMSLLYITLLVVSTYTMIGLVAGIHGTVVEKRLRGRVPERLAGGVLIGLGVFSLLRNLVVMITAILNTTTLPAPEIGVLISDFLLIPTWIIGGLLLWRHRALGYVGGTGLLFQGSMLFIGLIVWLMLTPVITGAPFVLLDIIVVFIMGLICFIPFARFVHAVAQA